MKALLPRFRWLIPALVVIGALALVRPWTVVPLAANDAGATSAVEADWSSQRMAAFAAAVEPAALQAGASAFVRGEGQVTVVDMQSRVGLLHLDANGDGVAEVAVQIGPVFRGTALRDALGLRFSDFANQVEFANAARDLNARAVAEIPLLRTDLPALQDRTVSFVGAARRTPAGDIEVLPLSLEAAP